jgi:hypothetical protein
MRYALGKVRMRYAYEVLHTRVGQIVGYALGRARTGTHVRYALGKVRMRYTYEVYALG